MEGVMVSSTANVTGMIRASHFNQTSVANGNVSLYYQKFSEWGPPETVDLTIANGNLYYPHNGSPMTGTPQTNSTGEFLVMIIPTSPGWPTSPYGSCVELQGSAEAELDTAGTTYTERFFMGRVCTYPTG
jgi:hypothetical protein